jgi:hypothetical protein
MGRDCAILELSAGDPEGHLHDQRDRVTELHREKGDEEPVGVLHGVSRDETVLHGDREYLEEVDDADQALEPGPQLPGYQIRTPDSGLKTSTQKS